MTAPKPFTADERAVVLIAASVSPNLKDGIREAFDRYEATVKHVESERDNARRAFRHYGVHDEDCGSLRSASGDKVHPCSCGYSAAIANLETT